MHMTQIREMLLESNPWWKGEFRVEFRERDIYRQIRKFAPMPQILALTGLRRTGKTTMLRKMADDAIKEGLDSRNVMYFSFDEFQSVGIRDVIREYERLMEKEIASGKYLFLLDEVQKVENWENQLKTLYDNFGKNVKMAISGSESLFIKKKSKETLGGRLFEFKVEPLSFREFLGFKGTNLQPAALYEKELAALFEEYILTMGFPEMVGVREKEIIRKYVKESIVEKAIYRDIPRLFRVRDVSILESLLNIFMDEPGQLIELAQLADNLKISRQTLSNYLSYLEAAFLIKKLYNFSRSKRKTERKLKKYYPTIVSPDLAFRSDDLSKSKVFEWLAVIQMQARFFWRDPYKNEVDIVIPNEKPIPIEVKYGRIETAGLQAFMRKFNVDSGYIISSNKEEKLEIDGKTIFVSPAFKFFLKLPME